MAKALRAEFAPAERLPVEIIRRQAALTAEMVQAARPFLDLVGDTLLILNRQRQVVYFTENLRSLASETTQEIIGQRLGEALGCVHATECASGCGGTEACLSCGAAQAIQAALEGRPGRHECRLLRLRADQAETLELSVTTTPFVSGGEPFCLCSIRDLSREKRRRVVDGAFFQEMQRTARSFQSLLGQWQHRAAAPTRAELEQASKTCDELAEQIGIHRDLQAAEDDSLRLRRKRVDARAILKTLTELPGVQHSEHSHPFRLVRGSEPIELLTDARILRHVLWSVLRHALAAASHKATVELGCRRRGEQVRFWVRYPGVVPAEEKPYIFDLPSPQTSRGLGLYAARMFTERFLGGRIQSETDAEQNTVLTVDLAQAGASLRPPRNRAVKHNDQARP